MIELRWVWHDLKDGPPPQGAILVSEGQGAVLYQKLQYRNWPTVDIWQAKIQNTKQNTKIEPIWVDVPHGGLV